VPSRSGRFCTPLLGSTWLGGACWILHCTEKGALQSLEKVTQYCPVQGRERMRFRSESYNDKLPPNRNLFVVNYEPETTTREDLEKFFAKWGEVERVQMKEKYSFIEVAPRLACPCFASQK
jgi:hypothetical protein